MSINKKIDLVFNFFEENRKAGKLRFDTDDVIYGINKTGKYKAILKKETLTVMKPHDVINILNQIKEEKYLDIVTELDHTGTQKLQWYVFNLKGQKILEDYGSYSKYIKSLKPKKTFQTIKDIIGIIGTSLAIFLGIRGEMKDNKIEKLEITISKLKATNDSLLSIPTTSVPDPVTIKPENKTDTTKNK